MNELCKNVTRENVLERIEELKKQGYCMRLCPTFSEFREDEDFIRPFIVIIDDIDTKTTVSPISKNDYGKSKGGDETSTEIYRLREWKNFELGKNLLLRCLKSIGGNIIKEDVYPMTIDGKHVVVAFATAQYIDRMGKVTEQTGHYWASAEAVKKSAFGVAKLQTQAFLRAIRNVLPAKGFTMDELKRGLVLVGFAHDQTTKNVELQKLIAQKIARDMNILGINTESTTNNTNKQVIERLIQCDIDSGITGDEYLEDEINQYNDEEEPPPDIDLHNKDADQDVDSDLATPNQIKKIHVLNSEINKFDPEYDDNRYRERLKLHARVDSSKKLTKDKAESFINSQENELKMYKEQQRKDTVGDKKMSSIDAFAKARNLMFLAKRQKKWDDVLNSDEIKNLEAAMADHEKMAFKNYLESQK